MHAAYKNEDVCDGKRKREKERDRYFH